MRPFFISTLAFASLLVPAGAIGQVQDGTFTLGGHGGWTFFDSKRDLTGTASYAPPEGAAVFGVRAGYHLLDGALTTELTASMVPGSFEVGGDFLGTNLRLEARYNFQLGRVVPFVAAGPSYFIISSDEFDTDGDAGVSAGGGALFFLNDAWSLRADVRWLPGDGVETLSHDIELTAGFGYAFGVERAPPPVLDADGDGLPDAKDKCPSEPEDMDGFEDADGCPEADNDEDGLLDRDDKCPDAPEDKNDYLDEDGCPDAGDDADNDGVPDSTDACRDSPEDKDGFEDTDGCPEADNDKDGFLDAEDKCPVEAEVVNGWEDLDGCGDAVPEALAAILGVRPDVKFAAGGRALKGSGMKALEAAAPVLAAHPSVKVRIRVAATRSKDDQALSVERAEGVRKFLVKKGAPDSMLVMEGVGAAPIPDGAPEGATADWLALSLEPQARPAPTPEPQPAPAKPTETPAEPAKPAEEAAKPAEPEGAKPAEDEAVEPAEDKAVEPAEEEAAKSAEDGAKPTESDAAKPAEETPKPAEESPKPAEDQSGE